MVSHILVYQEQQMATLSHDGAAQCEDVVVVVPALEILVHAGAPAFGFRHEEWVILALAMRRPLAVAVAACWWVGEGTVGWRKAS